MKIPYSQVAQLHWSPGFQFCRSRSHFCPYYAVHGTFFCRQINDRLPLLFQGLFNIHERVFSPGSPARPRLSALFPSPDISYIVWDTVDARKNPAASVELKVQSGGVFSGSTVQGLGYHSATFSRSTKEQLLPLTWCNDAYQVGARPFERYSTE